MKTLAFVILAALSAPAAAETKPAPNPAADAATKEIEKAFGFVPAFIKQFPRIMLASWWDQTKAVSFNPNTALDGKTKELIGLAVAASIPCEYCVLFHT